MFALFNGAKVQKICIMKILFVAFCSILAFILL